MRKIDKAYEFIKEYITKKEYPPTIREIADAIDVKSTSTVAYYLRKLEECNKIVKGSYKNRSIQLIENISTKFSNSGIITMPYITNINEGKPLMSEHNISDRFTISGSVFKGLDMFVVPVKNNAMKNSSILKGDMVVVSRQNAGGNGEMVVALVESNYMIGYLHREYNLFKLKFNNPEYSPIYLEKVTILGRVVGLIRNNIE